MEHSDNRLTHQGCEPDYLANVRRFAGYDGRTPITHHTHLQLRNHTGLIGWFGGFEIVREHSLFPHGCAERESIPGLAVSVAVRDRR